MKKKEIKRQIFHAGMGIFTAYLIYSGLVEKIGAQGPLSELKFLPVLSRPFLVTLIICSVIILISKVTKIPGIDWILKNFERPSDRKEFPGRGFFFSILAITILSLFFETSTVGASLLILSLGDSTSHLVGKKFGKTKHPLSESKKLEGNFIGAIIAGFGASIFINPLIAFIAAFIAMFIEGIELGDRSEKILEDNLVVTIVAGIIITTLKMLIP